MLHRSMQLPQAHKKTIDVKWTAHLKTPEEQEKFRAYVLSSFGALERLKQILEDKLSSREVFKEEDYKNPSWAFSQADRNGYARALKEVLNIITFEKV